MGFCTWWKRQVILPALLLKAELRYTGWEEGTLARLWPASDFRTQDSKRHEAENTNLDLTVQDMESGASRTGRMSEGTQRCLARGGLLEGE